MKSVYFGACGTLARNVDFAFAGDPEGVVVKIPRWPPRINAGAKEER